MRCILKLLQVKTIVTTSSDAYQTLSIEFALHHWTPLSDWRQLKESYVPVAKSISDTRP